MKRLLFILALVCGWAGIAQAQVPVSLAPSMHPQFLDSTGKVLSGGFVYTYQAGTTIRQDSYTDSSGTIINAWPIPLDATGSPSNLSTQTGIWLSNNTYKICAYSSAMIQAWCTDNVSAYQILNGVQNITFGGVTSDPTGAAGMLGYRSDLSCFRFFTSFWDCGVTFTGIQTLTNKTLTSPILTNPAINGVTPNAVVPAAGMVYTATSPGAAGFAVRTVGIPFIIDGASAVLTTGTKGYVEIPFACTITGWTALGDQVGSVVVDVKRSTYAGFPTTASIAGSDKPTLTAAQKNQNLSVSAWTTAIGAGDILEFNVNSVATITRVTISLRATIP